MSLNNENFKNKDECRNNSLCEVIRCLVNCQKHGPTGPTGATGATGPTGPTERLFKSSNKIIIDSS